MKKNKLTFIIAASLLALSSLAGCNSEESSQGGPVDGGSSNITTSELINPSSDGGNSQSSDGGNSSSNTSQSSANSSSSQGGGNSSQGGSDSSGGQEVKTDWTDTEKATMSDNLHGLILPFVAMDVRVSWNASEGYVDITSTENMTADFLASYAAKFTAADGWKGGDVSDELGLYANSGLAFSFMKKVTQNNADFIISVMFTGVDASGSGSSSYTKTGLFVLRAGEQYVANYPATEIAQWLQTQYNTAINPPAFDAEFYGLIPGTVYGYSETNIEASYKETLEASNNFTVDSDKNAEGFYVAHPSDSSYTLLFKYDSETKMLVVKVDEPRGWNANVINAFLDKYHCNDLVIPAIDNPNIRFRFYAVEETAGQEGAMIYVYDANLEMAQAYVNSMKAVGYIFNDDNVALESGSWSSLAILVTDSGTYSAVVGFEQGNNEYILTIAFVVAADQSRFKSWPGAQVAALLHASQDSVPAYTGENQGFTHLTNSGNTVLVYLPSGTEDNAKTAYIQKLLDAKYVEHSSTYGIQIYRSQHNEILVYVMSMTNSGKSYLAINAEDFVCTEWPTNNIATAIATKIYNGQNITDTIPALNVDLAEYCGVNTNYSDYEFEIQIEGLGSSLADFKEVFKQNGWINAAYYKYSYTQQGVMVSPNRQLVAYFSTYGEGKNISIMVTNYRANDLKVVGLSDDDATTDDWDFNNSAIGFVDATVPTQVEQHWYKTQILATFDVKVGEKFKATNGVDWYGYDDIQVDALPSDSDFVTDDDKNIVAVKDGTVNLYLKEFDDGTKKLIVQFATPAPVLNPWPEEDILVWFGDDFFDEIPLYEAEGVSYTIVNGEGTSGDIKFVTIRVDAPDALAYHTAFINYLINDKNYAGMSDYPQFYKCSNDGSYPCYAFGVINDDNNSFILTLAYIPEPEPQVDGYPAEDIADWLDSFHATDALPNIHLENVEYSTDIDDEGFNVLVYTPTSSNTVADIKSGLRLVFCDPNYQFYEDGSDYFTSKNGDFSVQIIEGTDNLRLVFYPSGYTSVYPSAKIAEYLKGLTVSSILTNPIVDDAGYQWFWPEGEDPCAFLEIFDLNEDPDDIICDVSALLYSEGFVDRYLDVGGIGISAMVSPNKDYCVIFENHTQYIVVVFYNLAAETEQVDMYGNFKFVPTSNDLGFMFNDGAVFYAYLFGGIYGDGHEWVKLEYNSTDGCFYLDGYNDSASIIIVRMDPAVPEDNPSWEYRWNQSRDISLSQEGEQTFIRFGENS